MKLDTLVDMAKETAAFGVHPSGEYIYSFYTEQLQAFAALVASAERESLRESFRVVTAAEASAAILHEREACANLRKEVELLGKRSTEYEEGFWDGLSKYEDLIRARRQA